MHICKCVYIHKYHVVESVIPQAKWALYKCLYLRKYMCIYICAYIYMYVCICIYIVYSSTCQVSPMYLCMLYIYINIMWWNQSLHMPSQPYLSMYIYLYIYVYIFMYVHIYVYICRYTYTYINTYTHIYIYIYIYIYTYLNI
jgi:hypothetical protein